MAFIIAAPLLALAWAVATYVSLGEKMVYAIFAAFNVAHHMPTFIRIYGDKELLRRFRWSLLFAPLIPFTLSMLVAFWLIAADMPIRTMAFLFIVLGVWDPWHFLMQHYGFMRIYDRHNAAPPRLAAWMDYLVCVTWFVFVMMAAADWLPELLYESRLKHGLPLVEWLGSGIYPEMVRAAGVVALAMTVVYAIYLAWCYAHGYFVSYAKLLLLLFTFGVMYVTYVPDSGMHYIFPQWTFALGFATLGMVHVTQYLAIVWKYNRSLSARDDRCRSAAFRKLFARGGLAVAAGYVAVCLLYGAVLTQSVTNAQLETSLKWATGCVLAIVFTSTFLHYYYDGFIWKVRHKENQENLAMVSATGQARAQTLSWWQGGSGTSLGHTLARQSLYFLPPLLFVICTFALWSDFQEVPPLAQARQALQLQLEGQTEAGRSAAQEAVAAIKRQIALEERMLAIQPRAKHYAYLGELKYYQARLEHEVLGGRSRFQDVSSEQLQLVQDAVVALERALSLPPPYNHREQPALTWEAIQSAANRWSLELLSARRSTAPIEAQSSNARSLSVIMTNPLACNVSIANSGLSTINATAGLP